MFSAVAAEGTDRSGRWNLLIAATPRSGGWLLAEGLRSLDIAGRPEEYFAPEAEQAYRSRWGMPAVGPFGLLLQRALEHGRTPNGVFAAKVHWSHLGVLLQRLRTLPGHEGRIGRSMTDGELLARHLGPVRIVYLDRRNTVRQAISWHRAITTNSWWAVFGDGPDRPSDVVGYDFEAIKTLWWLLCEAKASWRGWFQANHVQPLVLSYERLVADYPSTLRAVVEWLGMDAPGCIPPPRLVRQADQLSDQWARQYRRSWLSVFGSEPPRLASFKDEHLPAHPSAVETPQRCDHVRGR